MGGKAEARRIYESRVLEDALARLAQRFILKDLPFSQDELQKFTRRARESFKHREKRKEALERYKTQLAKTYGAEIVGTVAAALEDINNEIGYEEK